ncbi:hypothetical protein ACFL9T_21225 [Thermodesulfobacteriota bacterium]
MEKERIFTQEELEEMGTQTVDLLERAIDSGDKEKAKKLAVRMHKEAMSWHDFSTDWLAALLTSIAKHYGDDAVHKSLEESLSVTHKETLDLFDGVNFRRRVQLCAGVVRSHCRPLEVTEDDEKVVFKMKPCGTGGRMILQGKYDPPYNFHKVEKAKPMTFGRENFPIYCCHGHFFASLPVAMGRAPAFLEIPSDKLGEEPCEIRLYKDPKAIPSGVYEKCGIKPESLPQEEI